MFNTLGNGGFMKTLLRKDVKTGNGFKYRVHTKEFKTVDEAHEFLNAQYDNQWRFVTPEQQARGLNKKGVFIERGIGSTQEFLNTKNIDASALCHM